MANIHAALKIVCAIDKKKLLRRDCVYNIENKHLEINYLDTHTILPAKSDSDVTFCLQSCQGLRIDKSLVY